MNGDSSPGHHADVVHFLQRCRNVFKLSSGPEEMNTGLMRPTGEKNDVAQI